MKTADFLPAKAFTDHLDRRSTPKRLMILGAFSMLCLGAASALTIEANSQVRKAEIAETPDEHAQQAKVELQGLFDRLESEAVKLDPLTEHIKLPTASPILAGLAKATGRSAEIEKVTWDHSITKTSTKQVVGRVIMKVTCKVKGDDALLSLPGQLQELTGYEEAKATRVELVKGRSDLIRVDVELSNSMSVPHALVVKNEKK